MLNSFWWGSSRKATKGISWLSWDRLVVPKDLGGMGFRNIQGFTLAMLGKQGWKLLFIPDALVSRFFKAKYYLRGVFMDDVLGQNPSYSWSSIWSYRTILSEGIKWRIGSGHHVHVFNQPWLRNSSNTLSLMATDPTTQHMVLCDLWVENSKAWNEPLLYSLFPPDTTKAILQVPQLASIEEDKLIWSLTSNDMYLVKVGY